MLPQNEIGVISFVGKLYPPQGGLGYTTMESLLADEANQKQIADFISKKPVRVNCPYREPLRIRAAKFIARAVAGYQFWDE